jgi:hypothetical protein
MIGKITRGMVVNFCVCLAGWSRGNLDPAIGRKRLLRVEIAYYA